MNINYIMLYLIISINKYNINNKIEINIVSLLKYFFKKYSILLPYLYINPAIKKYLRERLIAELNKNIGNEIALMPAEIENIL